MDITELRGQSFALMGDIALWKTGEEARQLSALLEEELRQSKSSMLSAMLEFTRNLERDIGLLAKAGYNPNQPRVPAGNPNGGQWTGSGGGGGGVAVNEADFKAPDMQVTLDYLRRHAGPKSQNKCAKYVRMALNAGGFSVANTEHAKDYGAKLAAAGFKPVSVWDGILPSKLNQHGYLQGYVVTPGDVAVIQPYDGGNPSGHMTMYDGQQWLSDFRQRGIWSGQGYRNKKPPYIIYRYLHP